MANHTGLGLLLLLVTCCHHVSSMCAADMKGRVCKDIMLPPGKDNCIQTTDENWLCKLSTRHTEAHGHGHNILDFLESELEQDFQKRVAGGGLLEVSRVVDGQEQRIQGCEIGEAHTIYPQDTMQDELSVSYAYADKSAKYLLMMVDPDAPTNPDFCSDKPPHLCTYIHWVVQHIPGEILLQPSRLDEVTPSIEYRPPTPPSGVHRYQLLLFEMHAGQNVEADLPDDDKRDSFDLNYFIGVNNLCDSLRAAFQYRVQHGAA